MTAASGRVCLVSYQALVLAVAVAVAAILLACVPFALAYSETGATGDCTECHDGDYQRGPHGGYVTTSSKCDSCHSVHNAPSDSVLLLPGPTIKSTCETCHDGTGGKGVYGALAARGVPVAATHRIDVTRTVPGGDASTGGAATKTFTGVGSNLTCDDCHSPHAASVVESFTGDRRRITTDTTFFSNRLLKQRPTSAPTTVTRYGADWCGGCHLGRVSESSTVHNHPVDSTYMGVGSPFYYQRVAVLTTETSLLTTLGPLGGANRGYLMPRPRTIEQTGHAPICQQCHEDKRSVEVSPTPPYVAYFSITSADGSSSTDNPRFQVFPHEGENAAFQVETGEDLCLNCHPPGQSWP